MIKRYPKEHFEARARNRYQRCCARRRHRNKRAGFVMVKMNEDPSWRGFKTQEALLGLWLGYPRCCVHAWATAQYGALTIYGRDRPTLTLEGTGFVPCPKCNATYTDEELTKLINESRKCPTPFPNEPSGKTLYANPDFQAWEHALLNDRPSGH